MPFLRQSTSQVIRFGPCLDKTDGVTEEVSLTFAQADMRLSKDGGAFAQKNASGNATHDSDGWYSTTLDATDTNTVGELRLNVHQPANMLPVWDRWWVIEEAVYDAHYGAAAAGPLQPTVAGRTLGVESDGDLTKVNTLDGHTAQTGDNFARLGVAGAGLTDITLNAASIDLVWDEVLTGGTHNVVNSAGRRLRIIQESGSYHAGAVWIDTVNGTAGTTDFENGVDILPSDTIADANTIAVSIGLSRFEVAPGSSITFAAAQTNQTWQGRDWTLALGGQDITGSFIFGAIVSGIATATAGYEFEECDIGAVTLDNDGHFELCALTGTFTIGQAGTFTFHSCFTESASAITIDFAAVGATAVHLFDFNGEVNLKNMATGDTVHITGGGTITTETCTAGTIDHDGFFEYTDAGGNVTEVQSDIKVGVDAILVDTAEIGTAGAGLTDLGGMSTGMKAEVNAEADTALTDYDGPTDAEMIARTLVSASYFDPAADAVATVTTLTNLPSITANWLTAGGITASALNGKGDWNIGKTGYDLSTAGILAIWHQALTAIVTAGSVGKLLKDEITAVRMATLTDWIDGGRLDAILDSAATATALATAQADLDTLTGTDGVTLATAQALYAPSKAGDAMALTSGERDSIASALLDLSNGVETSLTLRQALRLGTAMLAGQISGAATTTATVKAAANPATTRLILTVDADGNRTALTLTP